MFAQGGIDFPAIDIWRCVCSTQMTKDFDKTCDDAFYFDKVGVNAVHTYQRSKKILLVAGRDFVMDQLMNQESDGTIIHVTSSNEDLNEKFPVPKGVVRGCSPIGGYIITPDVNDPNKSYVKFLLELDFGGHIPDFAGRTAFRDQGYLIDKLRKVIP